MGAGCDGNKRLRMVSTRQTTRFAEVPDPCWYCMHTSKMDDLPYVWRHAYSTSYSVSFKCFTVEGSSSSAFEMALHREAGVVSWLCLQVEIIIVGTLSVITL